jgi:hypothetical protein
MAFTRFHDDPVRIQKQIDESTFSGRYMLNRPGPGINMPFQADAQLRLQSWGANITTNIIPLESDFRGLGRRLCRDHPELNNHLLNKETVQPLQYGEANPFIEESRASHPAWMYRDLEQPRWEMPWMNPQAPVHTEVQFPNNIQTRILEKDYYHATVPNLGTIERADFFFQDINKIHKIPVLRS